MTLRQLVTQIDKGKMPRDYSGLCQGETFTNLHFASMGKKRNMNYVEFLHNGRFEKYDSSQVVEVDKGDLCFMSNN